MVGCYCGGHTFDIEKKAVGKKHNTGGTNVEIAAAQVV